MADVLLSLPREMATLLLETREGCESDFNYLLQSGVYLKTPCIGRSTRVFLSEQLGLPDDYIRQRISTIFLDGMPVDDLEEAVLKNGSRLALSSAMPGLVGATMRAGSPLASFRNGISYKGSCADGGRDGIVFLKLFNLVMSDCARSILNSGVIVPTSVLQQFLREHPALPDRCTLIQLNGRKISPEQLATGLSNADASAVELTVFVK